jgi:DNA polymerase I
MLFIQQQSELEKIIPNLLKKEAWGVDTETTGLDPHVNKVILLQIGRPEEVYVIDTRTVNIEPLSAPFLENKDIFKIFHNAKFDYKMLRGTFGTSMENIRCTFLAEKILSAGLTHYMSSEHKFDKVAFKRIGKVIENKEALQKSFIGHTGPFTPAQIEYAGTDAGYLLPVYKAQVVHLTEQKLMHTMKLESEACLAFGDMEFEGMLLDPAAWSKILRENLEEVSRLQAEMDKIVEKYIGTNLFGEVDINYGSPAQMLSLLKKMGIMINRYDFETKEDVTELIKKTDNNSLKQVKGDPFVDLLRKWRSFNIRVNNFGDSYIEAIHPHTGCIHPNFWQIGTGTGRPASGESEVNPLNVPREQKYRSCFICEKDEVVESDDFSGCESRILAHISQDPKMIDIFNRGEDIHCGAATELYGVTVTKNNENKHLRTPAKALNFGRPIG